MAASHLAYRAALKALARAGAKAEELDLIICATVTPDMAFPAHLSRSELLGVKNIPLLICLLVVAVLAML